ncbi:hypothetical protein RIF29_15404 [Crotalaria pallida]|uniref:Uncharacterized protein n=1 Tax=Crotalaria pallida TaxID=3830 RepID=A0AAN9FH59_CROPI
MARRDVVVAIKRLRIHGVTFTTLIETSLFKSLLFSSGSLLSLPSSNRSQQTQKKKKKKISQKSIISMIQFLFLS